jgi:hypothetical protein
MQRCTVPDLVTRQTMPSVQVMSVPLDVVEYAPSAITVPLPNTHPLAAVDRPAPSPTARPKAREAAARH